MKVAITGGTGFLGSRFIEIYKNTLGDICILNSSNTPLGDYNKLLMITKCIDVVVHAAFDHTYKNNITGIKNILKVCIQNKIKKLIHISTISVYDSDTQGILNENNKYSTFNDPYSKEKRTIEKEINKYKESGLDIVILQPTIIYGLGGNWTKYALQICKSKALSLTTYGEGICNAVYVDDVAHAIYLSCLCKIRYEKLIISCDGNITWKEFYKKQYEVLNRLNLPVNCNIVTSVNSNEFHSNTIINYIFVLWYKTPLGNIFNLIIKIMKKLAAKNLVNKDSKKELLQILKSKVGENTIEPFGITKKVHDCKYKVSSSKAKDILAYEAKVSFDDGINKIAYLIGEVVKWDSRY